MRFRLGDLVLQTLYLLIEEGNRELASRVLLARAAVAWGFRVVLGQQWWIWRNIDRLAPGVMLFKGCNKVQADAMANARRFGHAVAAIEEEALGLADDREIIRLYDPRIPELCDLPLAQGEHHAQCLREHFPSLSDRVVVTGNPRTDLLNAEFIAESQATQFRVVRALQPYILINTNYASINPIDGDTLRYYQRCVAAGIIDPDNAADISDFEAWCAWEHANIARLLELLGRYRDQLCPMRIILRPHPSERLTFWEELLADQPGIKVIRQGDHLPWTLGAHAVLHTSCTTGLEAALLDRPTLSLRAPEAGWDDLFLSNLVNQVAHDAESGADWLQRQIEHPGVSDAEKAAFNQRLTPHLAHVGSSAAATVQALADLASRHTNGGSEDRQPPVAVSLLPRQVRKVESLTSGTVEALLSATRILPGSTAISAQHREIAPFVHEFTATGA